jgi:hypothetical protein
MEKVNYQESYSLLHSNPPIFPEHKNCEDPNGKNFENALKFKSSPQNNGISTGFLKQMLC